MYKQYCYKSRRKFAEAVRKDRNIPVARTLSAIADMVDNGKRSAVARRGEDGVRIWIENGLYCGQVITVLPSPHCDFIAYR